MCRSRPDPGVLKCNVDAGFHWSINMTSYAAVSVDLMENLLCHCLEWFNPKLSVHEGEAMGLWNAMNWVLSLGFNNVSFECESAFG